MTKLDLPSCGLGCATLGKPEIAEDEAQATIAAALEAGVAHLDTAPLYGCGLSERRLGRALSRWKGQRPMLSTKVGYVIDVPEGSYLPAAARRTDYSPDAVRRSLEASLRRMGIDRVDLVYIHAPDGMPDQAEIAFRALDGLRDEGMLDAIGVGTGCTVTILDMIRRCPLDAALIAGRLTLLDRSAEDGLLEASAERNVAVVAGGVFNSGILAAADPARAHYDYTPAQDRLVATTRSLAAACARFGVPLKSAAIRFVSRHPGVTTTLLGAASRSELAECLLALDCEVPDALWAELDRVVARRAD